MEVMQWTVKGTHVRFLNKADVNCIPWSATMEMGYQKRDTQIWRMALATVGIVASIRGAASIWWVLRSTILSRGG